jgi:Uma2 family endonuclease
MVAKVYPRLTVDDLDSLPDDGNRYEIIDGELFVTHTLGLTHRAITSNLIFAFRLYLKQNTLGRIFPTPGVIFSDFDAVIPDLVFISHERLDEIAVNERLSGAPEIIIEILSQGSENQKRDRQIKRQLYRKYGVKEYWIIDAEQSTVEIYRSPKFNRAKISRWMKRLKLRSCQISVALSGMCLNSELTR